MHKVTAYYPDGSLFYSTVDIKEAPKMLKA